MPPSIELLQFPYSHYNEKVRWALDRKGAEHKRTNLLPGPHAMTTVRLTGQTQVPIARFDSDVVNGSAAIIDELERRYPEPALYPADAGERERALEVQRYFDDEIGPMVRRGVFAVLTQELDYLASMFSEGHGAAKRRIYRAMMPVTAAIMKSSMGVRGRESIEEGIAGTQAGLDFVARERNQHGFLVGDAFSVADLAAAALLAPAVAPPDSTMSIPEPRPERVQLWLGKWADHPGASWVLETYAKHRETPGKN